jgi:hypothetical protein
MSEFKSENEGARDSMLSSTESFIVEAGQALAIAFRHASFGGSVAVSSANAPRALGGLADRLFNEWFASERIDRTNVGFALAAKDD